MKNLTILKKSLLVATLVAIGSPAIAADKVPFKAEIKARKSQMHIYKFNMGILGAMAKGKREFNAEEAKAAANNIAIATSLNAAAMWPKGSDNSQNSKTDALPSIWENLAKVGKINDDMGMAAKNLAGKVDGGLGALRKNIGAVGKNCKGCHDDYKAD